MEKVNVVGKTMQTVDEVKRRYQDIRRRTKEKLAYNKTSANKTGGGTVEKMPLTSIAEQEQLTHLQTKPKSLVWSHSKSAECVES